jgi:hypothetical protein
MAETTETLAIELRKSERQVLNYKRAVEKHLGFPITTQQGKQHFYKPQYAHLVRIYAKGEPLPEVAQEFEVIPSTSTVVPTTAFSETEEQGGIVLATRKLAAPDPMQVKPLHLLEVDTEAIDAQTKRNQTLLGTFKQHLRAQVLGEAAVFGEELKAEVKHSLTRATAEAYQELLEK